MKLKELIEKAQEALNEYGNLPVLIIDPDVCHIMDCEDDIVIIGNYTQKFGLYKG